MTTHCPYCRAATTPRCPGFLAHLGEFHCTRAAGHDGPHVACHPTIDRHEIRTWRPTMDDIARDLVAHATALRTTITRAREHLDAYARHPHDEHCDGDHPCPRDLAEETLALLRI